MRNYIQSLFVFISMAVFSGMLAFQTEAQVYTNFYGFSFAYESSSGSIGTNGDGANPVGGLCLSGNTLYGTANNGGISGSGTVFKVQVDGSGFTNLHNFSGLDGANPQASLVLCSNTLYGTTYAGGSGSSGTLFALNTDGTGFTNLHNFTPLSAVAHLVPATNSDGAHPNGLILSGNILYGTAAAGGAPGNGTVFAINIDGTGFTNLHIFSGGSGMLNLKNNDGINPVAGLILYSNTLYGTTARGGPSGVGVVFALNPDGTSFTNLHSFSGTSSAATNNDGADPQAGLIVSGNTLYGTTAIGGTSGHGTVFAMNLDSTNLLLLYSFTGTNGDGVAPQARLAIAGKTLYGSTDAGGSSSNGILFAINTDGAGFTNLFSFNIDNDYSSGPNLILAGNHLYGTASGIIGVSFGTPPAEGFLGSPGSVFGFSLPVPPPQLAITLSGTNVILTWPTNSTGYILQSAPNPTPAATWTPVVPTPVIINQLNSVTNPITGSQQFYRLIQPGSQPAP